MNNSDFETFLLIRPNKFSISIYKKYDFKKIYEKEIFVENKSAKLEINTLNLKRGNLRFEEFRMLRVFFKLKEAKTYLIKVCFLWMMY